MESRKMVLMNLFAEQQWKRRQTRLGDTVREREGGMNSKSNVKAYTLPYVKQIASRNLLYDKGSSNPVLYDNLDK